MLIVLENVNKVALTNGLAVSALVRNLAP